jgi:hypothetical protein
LQFFPDRQAEEAYGQGCHCALGDLTPRDTDGFLALGLAAVVCIHGGLLSLP